jgi:hypothetical protein
MMGHNLLAKWRNYVYKCVAWSTCRPMLIHFSLFKYPLTICLDYVLQVFVMGRVSDTANYRSLFSGTKFRAVAILGRRGGYHATSVFKVKFCIHG